MHNATPQSTCPDAERQAEARLAALVDAVALPLYKARGLVALVSRIESDPSHAINLLYVISDYLDAIAEALDSEISSGE